MPVAPQPGRGGGPALTRTALGRAHFTHSVPPTLSAPLLVARRTLQGGSPHTRSPAPTLSSAHSVLHRTGTGTLQPGERVAANIGEVTGGPGGQEWIVAVVVQYLPDELAYEARACKIVVSFSAQLEHI